MPPERLVQALRMVGSLAPDVCDLTKIDDFFTPTTEFLLSKRNKTDLADGPPSLSLHGRSPQNGWVLATT